MWPQITAGIEKSGPMHTTLRTMARIPNTRLQMASPEFFGCAGVVGAGGDSFIYVS
jgi:hypothetical protein